MTLKEKIIATAYTGVNFCQGDLGGEYNKFLEYAGKLMGRPAQTVEMVYQSYWDKLRELSKPDFDRMIHTTSDWTPAAESLPSDEGWYLVTAERYDGEKIIDVSSYHDNGMCYYWGIESGPMYKVLAWMPLPEIWEG